ncbi:MAG: hypothetical protein V1856_03245 [Candidatus Liptonbacteria bacterium]
MDKSKKIWMVLAVGVALIAALGAGYYIGDQGDRFLQATLDRAKKLLMPTPYNLVMGYVRSIEGNIVKVEAPNNNPLDEALIIREVAVGNSTTFLTRVNKNQEEIDRDWKQFQAEVAKASSGTAFVSPVPFAIVDAKFSDLRVGDYIYVDTTEKISGQIRVEATKIRIEPAGLPMGG